jgi:hypothetical protein
MQAAGCRIRELLVGVEADRIAERDGSGLHDIRAKTSSVDEAPHRARLGEPFQVSAGFAPALSETDDLPDSEALTNQAVQVDAFGDDVAASLLGRDAHSSGLELSEGLGLDERDVLPHPPRVRREGSGLVLLAVAVDSARAGGHRLPRGCAGGGAGSGHQGHDVPDSSMSRFRSCTAARQGSAIERCWEKAVNDLELLTAVQRVEERTGRVTEHQDGPPAAR